MTPKFKPGDKVRVVKVTSQDPDLVGREFEFIEYLTGGLCNTTEEEWYWEPDCFELVPTVTIEQAIKVLTDAGYTVAEARPTSIRDWKPGECGVEKDGTKWYRTEDGAIVDTGAKIHVWQDELLHDFPAAIKNPKLKLTLNWSEQ